MPVKQLNELYSFFILTEMTTGEIERLKQEELVGYRTAPEREKHNTKAHHPGVCSEIKENLKL